MELYIKRFIDVLDDKMPVTMVHTVVEQALGAVMIEHHIIIHARLDLTDQDSPYIEFELYPKNKKEIEIILAFTFPKKGIVAGEDEFINKLLNQSNILAERIVPLEDEDNYYFEAFCNKNINIPMNNNEIDKNINQLVSEIFEIFAISGYGIEEED